MVGLNAGRTALADLYKDEPSQIARFSALFLLGNMLAMILVPMLGGALAARNLHYPYIMSAFFCAVNLCIVKTLPETLPESERTRLSMRGMPPLFVVTHIGVVTIKLTGD